MGSKDEEQRRASLRDSANLGHFAKSGAVAPFLAALLFLSGCNASGLGSLTLVTATPLSTPSTTAIDLEIASSKVEPGEECPTGGTKVVAWNELGGTAGVYDQGIDSLVKTKLFCGVQPDVVACSANGQEGCLTNQTFKSADLSQLLAANIRDGITIAGVAGSLIPQTPTASPSPAPADNQSASSGSGSQCTPPTPPTDCSANGQIGCMTTTVFKAADLSNLIAANIKTGAAVAGVTGIYPSVLAPLENSAGTDLPGLTAAVAAGTYQFFKSDGTRVTGTISDAGTITPQTTDQVMAASLYRTFTVKGDAALVGGNIRSPTSIFGVTGTLALPATSAVRSSSSYGTAGTEFTGALADCSVAATEGCVTTATFKPYEPCTSDGSIGCAANATYRASREISSSIVPTSSNYDEGSSVVFNIGTSNIPNGSVLTYRLTGSGISGSDFATGSLYGTTTVNSNAAAVTLPITNDLTLEGAETVSLTLYSAIGSATVDINDTSSEWIPTASQTLFWYDAADQSTVTSSAGKVSSWADKGPNGYNLTQSTSSYQPSYQTTGWNSGTKPYLDWGNVSNAKSLVNTTSMNVREIFVVAQFDGGSTFGNFEGLVAPSNASIIIFTGVYSGTSWYPSGTVFGTNFFLNGETAAGAPPMPGLASPGLVHGRTSTLTTIPGFTVGMDRDYNTLNRGWRGKIAEVIGYTSALTVSERQKIEGYLAWKWGIQSSLVTGHPYQSVKP